MPHFIKYYKIDIICWGFFIAYEIMMVGLLSGYFGSFWNYFVHYVIYISLFYLHATVVLPVTLQKEQPRYWLIPILVIGQVIAFIAVTYTVETIITQHFNVKLSRPLVFDYNYCLAATWRAIYFMGFATGYYFLITTLRERMRAELAERQHLLDTIENQSLQNELIKSQNAFLKAQINPHFLFNTLSFVYNSVRKTSSEASEVIISLSQMMRYALQSDNEHQEAFLLDEIEQVENLIYIHQIRHNHLLHINLAYEDDLAGVKIIPLVLITLVENIFKHGDLMKGASPAHIGIKFKNGRLTITTANIKISESMPGHSIGLNNIRSRLYHAYKDRASFDTRLDERGYFHVTLQISSSSYSNSSYSVPNVEPSTRTELPVIG